MRKLVLFMTLALFSLSLYPKSPKASDKTVSVLPLTFAQFKEGLSKLKDDEELVRVSPDINKQAVNAAYPNAKLKQRWLTKQAAATCPKLIIQYVWELYYVGHMYEDNNFEFCADINEAVVSYRTDPANVSYTCIAEKAELVKDLFPNLKSDNDVVVEAVAIRPNKKSDE